MKDIVSELAWIIQAQARLLICYRLGTQPPEWVFTRLNGAQRRHGDLSKIATNMHDEKS